LSTVFHVRRDDISFSRTEYSLFITYNDARARELTLSLEDSANLFMGMLMYRKSDA
jgi:hypothetical protein